jgi:coproporphyrinogen dehydrogenase HemZ
LYKISVPTEKSKYDLLELAKMFLPADEIEILSGDTDRTPADLIIAAEPSDKNARKRQLYDFLSEKTGKTLDWGILTGVRPAKLLKELLMDHSRARAEYILKETYLVSEEKVKLLFEVNDTEHTVNFDQSRAAVGVYVGIPFCPTRCLYCSFPSNKISKEGADRYLSALNIEIEATTDILKSLGWYAESIYIGGGTPTSLDEADFDRLLRKINKAFVCEGTKEFTVECGRPDTISDAKLQIILEAGAGRISINPQSMKASTMHLIGRSHTPAQIVEAFGLARNRNVPIINADLIAGLPEESPKDFSESLRQVLALAPANITIHTLSVKKASRLIEEDSGYAFKQAENVREMLIISSRMLKEKGYRPYYLYRQKHMAGNFENVGYALPGTESLYNMRIMSENQSIVALGAGAISKIYFPDENRLERIANVSNYQIYIDRIQDMIDRKKEGIL